MMRDAAQLRRVETNFEQRGAPSPAPPLLAFLLSGRLAPDLPGRGLNREREAGERCKQGGKGEGRE